MIISLLSSSSFFSSNIKKTKGKNVVITGSSKGIGKALAKEFIQKGHNVIITSRNQENVNRTIEEFDKEFNTNKDNIDYGNFFPIIADVSSKNDCRHLAEQSMRCLGKIDIWITNAGSCAYKKQSLLNFDYEDVSTIVDTNLKGTIFGSQEAISVMLSENNGGAPGGIIINMEGAGSNGFPTPGYSVYGSTKQAITQFTKSISYEYKHTNIHFCTISPGMVMTELLRSDMDEKMKHIFHIFSETPEYIANYLVNKIERIDKNTNIYYLTYDRIIFLMVLSLFRKKRDL